MSRKSFRLAAAAVSAVSVFSLAGVTLAVPALAADPAQGPAISTIDQAKKANLIVHKHEGPATNGTRNGTEQTLPNKGLAGAQFSVYKVMDLKTNADWNTARKYYDGSLAYAPSGTPVVKTTGADGSVTFDNLDLALYFVVETKSPEGYTGASPFFVTLPMTNPNKTEWMYDVHVYPKNDKVNTPHKSVTDQPTLKVGNAVNYTVSTPIPNYGDVVGPVQNGKYTGPDGKYDRNDLQYFFVTDTFDTNLSLTENPVQSVTAGGQTLALTTDYEVTVNGQEVVVRLTDSGLDKAASAVTADNSAVLTVNYTATVKSIPADGQIPNKAYVIPGPKPANGSTPNKPTTPPPPTDVPPTNEVKSKFARIQIKKVGVTGQDNSAETPLAGVEFKVYPAVKTGSYPNFKYSCAAADLNGATAIDGFTTDANGLGTSSELALSNWYNDGVEKVAGTDNTYLSGADYATKYGFRNYCLVETKAASGYQLLAEPIEFSLTKEGTTILGDTAERTKVVNQADNIGNSLPLTGGKGIIALVAGGVALIGGGTAYYMVSSRRRREEAAA